MTFFFFFKGRTSGAVVTGVPGTVALGYSTNTATSTYTVPTVGVAYSKPSVSLVITL